ncbi:MAG: anti-sigma factor family protein [Anaerolineaceae bacterium]
MNHQPYENWILDEVQIDSQEQDSLKQHLKECPECFKLNHSWNKVQTEIKSTPVEPAPAGFMRRWKYEFASRQRELERRQARTLFISLASGAGAVLIALAVILLPDFSFISLMVRFLTTLVKLFSGIDSIVSISRNLIESAPTITLIIIGMFIAGWICLAVFAWGLSIYRITTKGVKNK